VPNPAAPNRIAPFLLALGLLVPAGAAAAPPEGGELPAARCAPEGVPPDAELEAAGATIGEIVVCAEEIFDLSDPAESGWIYRTADKLHRKTRRQVVERQLLFRGGEPYRGALLAESERLLRAQNVFYSARVLPIRYHDGVVDVGVTTRDNWSLKPSISFKRTGGTNKLRFDVQESNFLGWAKDVTIAREDNVDRTTLLLRYRDPQLFGTRMRLEASYSDNSDGRFELFDLRLPFFALDTRRAFGTYLFDGSLDVDRYELGEVRDSFHRRDEYIEGWVGVSPGLVGSSARRLRAGFTFDESEFSPTAEYPDAPIPENRKLAYPWISLQWIEDRFVVERDVDRIDRPEDLNLGWNASGRLGWSSRQWGADRDALVFEAGAARGWRASPRQLLFPSAALRARLDSGRPDPLLASLGLRYHLRLPRAQALYAAASFDFARNLESDQQLLLGGDTGLRGYPLRYQEGDRRALFTLEQRWYGSREILRVVRLGAAAFVDVGRAWFAGQQPGPADRGWLTDLGVGLRIAPSRSAHANVVRLEVAFPMNRADGIDSVQYLVTTSETF